MSLLLDTHVWIWSQECPERIGVRANKRIIDASQSLLVATISTLEIARLIHVDALELEGKLDDWISDSLEALGASSLELTHAIAAEAYRLPNGFHRDPADRILVATARQRELTLVTADDRILAYRHVRTLDARR